MKMTFGKYKGEELEQIPLTYLQWVEENCNWIKDDLREALNEEIKFRVGEPERSSEGRSTGKRF